MSRRERIDNIRRSVGKTPTYRKGTPLRKKEYWGLSLGTFARTLYIAADFTVLPP